MMYAFIRDLLKVFPNSFYYKRKKFPVPLFMLIFLYILSILLSLMKSAQIKTIVKQAKTKDFTDIMIINEDHKKFSAHFLNGKSFFDFSLF